MKNPTLVFFDDTYGYTATSTREAGRDLDEKSAKKWWKHFTKNIPPYISVSLTYENEDGNVRDITERWFMDEMCKWQDANCTPFN